MRSHLEDYIYELYTSIGVVNPSDLDMRSIAKKLGVEIVYKRKSFNLENEIILVRSGEREEWMEFGHEICHFLRHYGNQLDMHPLFIDLQEYQANYFAYHFCVPTFMLDRLFNYTLSDIMNLFNVGYEFASKRLDMYKNKIYSRVLLNGHARIGVIKHW